MGGGESFDAVAGAAAPTPAALSQLRVELEQEKERRAAEATKLRAAEAATRELDAQLGAVKEEFAAALRQANDRVSLLETALQREKERQNDVSRLEVETAGRLDGLRSLVDQRVEVLSGSVDAVRARGEDATRTRWRPPTAQLDRMLTVWCGRLILGKPGPAGLNTDGWKQSPGGWG